MDAFAVGWNQESLAVRLKETLDAFRSGDATAADNVESSAAAFDTVKKNLWCELTGDAILWRAGYTQDGPGPARTC